MPAPASLQEPITETPTGISAFRLDNDRRVARAIFFTLIVIDLLLAMMEVIVLSGGWAASLPLFAMRASRVAVLLAGLVGVARVKTPRAFEEMVLATTAVAILVELAIRLLRPPDNITPVWTEIVIVVGCYAILPNRRAFQAIAAILLSIGTSVILVAYNTGVSLGDRVGIMMALAIANGAGIVASTQRVSRQRREEDAWRNERDARLEVQRAHSEIRILHGLLPTCAHCRRIRTETGEWQPMERYVAAHSEAQFSHGFCPDCVAKYYPEVTD